MEPSALQPSRVCACWWVRGAREVTKPLGVRPSGLLPPFQAARFSTLPRPTDFCAGNDTEFAALALYRGRSANALF